MFVLSDSFVYVPLPPTGRVSASGQKTSLFLESPACRAAALLQPGGAIAPKILK